MSTTLTAVLAVYRYHDGGTISLPIVLNHAAHQYQLKLPSGAVIPICRYLAVQNSKPDAEFLRFVPDGVPVRFPDLPDFMRAWTAALSKHFVENQPTITAPVTPTPPQPTEPEIPPTAPVIFRNGVPIPIEEVESPAVSRTAAFSAANQTALDNYAANLRQSGRRH